MRRIVVIFTFLLLSLGSVVAGYQNLRWDCLEPGGGQAGYFWPLQDVYHYPYMNCVSRWPNFLKHWPRGIK
jgi:hypothetical protein